jgi:hypothetical protein
MTSWIICQNVCIICGASVRTEAMAPNYGMIWDLIFLSVRGILVLGFILFSESLRLFLILFGMDNVSLLRVLCVLCACVRACACGT